VFVDDKAIEFFSSRMLLVKINAGEDTLIKKEYNVSGFPTNILMDARGNEIDRMMGFAPTDEYLKTMIDYASGVGTLDDLLNRAKGDVDRALYFEIAEKYKYRGGLEEAGQWYEKVIEAGDALDSLSGRSRLGWADMYRRAKDYDRSLAAFQAVLDDFPNGSVDQEAMIYKAYILKVQGNNDKALAVLEDFVKTYPESEDVEWAQEQIDKLKAEPADDAGDK